jgi:hypothetical protein
LNTNPQKWNQRHRKELIMEDDRGDQVNWGAEVCNWSLSVSKSVVQNLSDHKNNTTKIKMSKRERKMKMSELYC